MTTETPNSTNTLCITQDDVIRVIMRIIDVDGLEAARAAFKQMNEFFSGVNGWAETTDAVYSLFANKRKEEKQQSREERLEEQRIGAPNIVVLTKATSDAKSIGNTEIDKMEVDVKSPGNTIARTIKIDKKDDERNRER